MKQKKIIKWYFIIISILLLPLPILNIIGELINNDEFSIQQLNKKVLFPTDKLEGNLNYLSYKTFGYSFNKGQAIIGKDGFLFLGNDYKNVLDKTQGIYPYTLKDIERWSSQLKNIQNWYEARDIKFVIVVAPNKHTVYKTKLPNWVNTNHKTIIDDIVSYSKKKNIHILDLRDVLINQNKPQLYFSTDTHWNNKGASIGYKETIKYINEVYPTNYKVADYNLSAITQGSGDLAYMLKIGSFLPKDYETNYKFNIVNESNVCHGIISKNHILQKCNVKKNPTMFINEKDQYMINNTSVNKDKLLLLCDSFGTATSKPYNETFNTIWKFHYGHINGQALASFIDKNKPDMVIYQIVERGLYNFGIVKKLPSSL